jgi:hypothetical protein
MGVAFHNRPQKVFRFAHLESIFRAHAKAVQFPEAGQYSSITLMAAFSVISVRRLMA